MPLTGDIIGEIEHEEHKVGDGRKHQIVHVYVPSKSERNLKYIWIHTHFSPF